MVEELADGFSDPALSRARLPRVLHDSPAAILLLDRSSGQVVRANPAGRQLCDVRLPAPATAWADAVGLQELPQAATAPGPGVLERMLAGEPVPGQVVRAGEGVLWLTGFPLPGPDHDTGAGLAILVLLPVDAGRDAAEVRDRAVVAAGLSFTISDPHQPDNPLVFVNPAFERTTGYASAEVLGRNCRLLQGPDTDPAAVQQVRTILAEQRHASVTLLNYRKDGTAFWNEVALSPVYDPDGGLTHFVGIQTDVTARILVESERRQHLAAEREARQAAEQAQRRLALLAEATSMLASTLDVDESLDRLTALVVPVLADFCTVHLLNTDGDVQRVVARHRDPDKAALLDRIEALQPDGLSDRSITSRVLRGAPGERFQVDAAVIERAFERPGLGEAFAELGTREAIIVPLRARRQVLGALSLFAGDTGRTFTDEDLDLASDIGRRAALTVDNARLYQREHRVAEQLQRSLLPVLPVLDGLDTAARYLPGATAAEIGGDWYDVLRLPDGVVGIAIGDVMGHDLAAAASMGQLRSVLQSYAWQGSSPAVVLDRLDQLVQGLSMAQLATCVYGRLELPAQGRHGRLTIANAGHLPPAVRGPDGSVRLIATEADLLVGAVLGSDRTEVVEPIPAGSVLVLCTDGLVEHRGRSIDAGLVALQQALASAPAGSAEAIADHLVHELADDDLDDDVALLVVRVPA